MGSGGIQMEILRGRVLGSNVPVSAAPRARGEQ